MNGLLLTPDFGPRQQVVSIVTDARHVPSPMYNGPALCRPDVCGRACIRACPTRAFKEGVGGYRREDLRVRVGGPRKMQVAVPGEGFSTDQSPYIRRTPPKRTFRQSCTSQVTTPFDAALNQHGFVPHCGVCIFRCPSPRFVEGSGRRSSKVEAPPTGPASGPAARRCTGRAADPI